MKTTSGIVGCEGGELYIDGYDVRLTIPTGSIEPGSSHNSSISIIDGSPPPQDINIDEGEFLAAPGVRCVLPELWDPYKDLREYSDKLQIGVPESRTMSIPHSVSVTQSKKSTDIIVRNSKSSTGII